MADSHGYVLSLYLAPLSYAGDALNISGRGAVLHATQLGSKRQLSVDAAWRAS